MEQTTVILTTLVLYKLTLIGIGFWAKAPTQSNEDFFLGGRALGPVVGGISYSCSASSAFALLGRPLVRAVRRPTKLEYKRSNASSTVSSPWPGFCTTLDSGPQGKLRLGRMGGTTPRGVAFEALDNGIAA